VVAWVFFAALPGGAGVFLAARAEEEAHPIEATGRELRKLMSWVKAKRAEQEQHPIEATGRELRKLMSWVATEDDYQNTANR
jgi:ketol-acid reductoisomerase